MEEKVSKKLVMMQNKKGSYYFILLPLFALMLNQSKIIGGINMSISDIVLPFIILILIFKGKLVLPGKYIFYFVFLSISVVSTAFLVVPILFNYFPEVNSVLANYLKICVSFAYFLLGYSIEKSIESDKIIKWFSLGVLILAIISILYSFVQINLFRETFFYGGTRFRGLMNDPNYFSVLQIMGLIYYIRDKLISKQKKLIIICIILFSILLSGSKTGLLTVLIYFVFYFVENNLKLKFSLDKILFFQLMFLCFFLISVILFYNVDVVLNSLKEIVPSIDRVIIVFSDFSSAISGGGSSRNITWGIALDLIKKSPLFGIGVGTYIPLSEHLYNSGAIAHNTYLQLAVEWGLILTGVFYFHLAKKILDVSFKRKTVVNLIYRDIIIVFLISSLAISLNNVRLFWFVFGALVIKCRFERIVK